MARSKTNKSEAIRGILAEKPKAKVKEVISLLAEKGVKVSPTFVYYVRSRQRHMARKVKRQQIAENTARSGVIDPVKLILQVHSLAKDAGGIRSLKLLVDALAE